MCVFTMQMRDVRRGRGLPLKSGAAVSGKVAYLTY